MSTALVYHPDYLQHDTGPLHPETADRLRAVMAALERSGQLARLTRLPPQPAALEWITAVHTPAHVAAVRAACRAVAFSLDMDTIVCAASYDVALLAAGGVLAACDAVMAGTVANAFCAVRPPGHHAESNQAMGFCLFNNVAVAARYLQRRHGLRRVLIVDWDVHHGNGTQEIFYHDGTVFYFSTHQHPLYPGTGAVDEHGAGEGVGTTLNVPLHAGAGDAAFIDIFEHALVHAAREFQPEFILLSAGFDAHEDDPIGGLNVTDDGFARITQLVLELAKECCQGRLVSVLEGGYDLDALGRSVSRHVAELQKA